MENVLDVLMYLFENYDEQEHDNDADQDVLREELLQAGFAAPEIESALHWLEGLSSEEAPFHHVPCSRSARIYTPAELARLDSECLGYILYLEQIGILNPQQREVVLDRLMALGVEDIDVEQVKWVVLMVLFSQPGQETAFARMEDLVFEDNLGAVH
jgi:Smg protein